MKKKGKAKRVQGLVALVGMSYPVKGVLKRIKAGERCDDLPADAVAGLLERKRIGLVEDGS